MSTTRKRAKVADANHAAGTSPKATIIDRVRADAKAPTNLTETPEAAARRLAGELEQKTIWLGVAEREKRALQSRVTELEALCLSISVLARKATGEDRPDPDQHIPF